MWPGRRTRQEHPVFLFLQGPFALSCKPPKPKREPIISTRFFVTERQSGGKGGRTKMSPQLLHQAPPSPLPAKGIARALAVLTETDSSHRRRRSGPVDTCEGNLESPRNGDHGAVGAMLMIHRIGRFVLVWIKLGIRLRSWGRDPGNIRIDTSSRTGVFGLGGGEHTLHGLR